MKATIRILLLAVIVCSVVISVRFAVTLYREKYAPHYFNGNAC